MAKEGYKISDLYQGGSDSFSPSYGNVFIGYRVPSSQLGAPTKPDTANQIQQVNQLLNQGIVPIEVGALSPEVFDQIPKQHFKEINRLAKLTGAKISVHAPLIEASGFTQQGWSEENRELAERQLREVVEKSSELSDKGGMPITIHSAGIPGSEYSIVEENGKRVKKMTKLIAVDQESGKMIPIVPEERFYPEGDLSKGRKLDPQTELAMVNDTQWENSLSQSLMYQDNANKIIDQTYPITKELWPVVLGNIRAHTNEEFNKQLSENISKLDPTSQEVLSRESIAQQYLKEAELSLRSLFSKAYKYASDDEKKFLKDVAENYKEVAHNPQSQFDLKIKQQAIQTLFNGLSQVHPELYVPIEDFAMKHSAETFANVAFGTFKEHGDKSPTISIENLYPGMAFAYGKEFSNLLDESRKKFVEKAVEGGYSEREAKDASKKVIGATFDVGHLNIAKKLGFKDEDLAKEAEQIAKYVKHVHLTDNFGYSDSHLPPGMANVPFKKYLEILEKAGKGDATKIVEAGGFVQHFQTSPLATTLEAFGSPIYSMKMAPYWNQALGAEQSYFSGYGAMLPNINYQTFGAGFSQLPQELGGQAQGGQGNRMSGRPME